MTDLLRRRDPARHPSTQSRGAIVLRVLALATAALLVVDAVVHLRDAGLYDQYRTSTLTEGAIFRAEAVAAIVVALAVLIWPRVLTFALAALVAASAVGAVLLYTYVDVGQLGPLPTMYEATWAPPGKVLSAVAEGAATVVSLAGLVLALTMRRARTR
jgi:hypothetical protein